MTTHFKVGFKSGAGFPVMFDPQYGTLEKAQAAAKKEIDAGYGQHFVWKVTVEEVPQ